MLKLYHAPQSRSSSIVWLLEELGCDYEIAYSDIARADGSGAADPANPHPDGKVPVLVHDGETVTESPAIVLYLTDLFPAAGLGPGTGEAGRGAYLSRLCYYGGVVEPVITAAFAGFGDNEAFRRTFRGRAELDSRIIGALTSHSYIAGDKFTGADILYSSMGLWMRSMLPAGSRVDDYLRRCHARPALAAAGKKDRPSTD